MKKSRSSQKAPEVLLYADSDQNTDMLYFGRVAVPDAFLAFSCKGNGWRS
jgi:hypothetical protein